MIKLMNKYKKNKPTGIFNQILQNEKWAQGAPLNTIVTAEVKDVDYNAKKVIIFTGFKSNSAIGFQEFKINGEDKIPSIGDQITVMVKGIDEETGVVLASFREVQTKQKMIELEEMFQQKQTIEGNVLYKIKSPYIKGNSYAVDLGYGILGLLTVDNYVEVHIGEKIPLDIVKFENKKLGIILKMTNEGVAMSGEKNNNNSHNNENFLEGEKIKIRVTEIKDFGIIGEKINENNTKDEKSNNGILVHTSELFWNKRSRTATEIEKTYPIGSIVTIMALRHDPVKNRTIFTIRGLFENLFSEFQNYVKKNNLKSIIGNIIEKRNDSFIIGMPFTYNNPTGEETKQIFEGRLYIRDLSWNQNEIIKKQRELSVGDEITCKLLDFDASKYQVEDGFFFIPLSVKHLNEDPFQEGLKTIKLGNIYNCYFVEYNDNFNGFLVNLEFGEGQLSEGLNIIIKHKDLGSLHQVKPGVKSTCKIIRIEEQDRLIFASVKAAESENKEHLLKEYASNNKQSASTLGSIIREK